ncbi:MAG: hypothetical protein HY831_04670 [Candidatus Aenigmarchaeota archaeon]|nr:hypothetical protein [Candidatus Aenigmarchaeota archaeon]
MSKRFPRQNSFRFKKLGEKWRRPRGGQSKTRMDRKGRARKPKPGYGSPANERFSINGVTPIFIRSVQDLHSLKAGDIIMISSTLGLKSAAEIGKISKTKGLKIFNKKKVEKVEKILLRKEREKEANKKEEVKDIPKKTEEVNTEVKDDIKPETKEKKTKKKE